MSNSQQFVSSKETNIWRGQSSFCWSIAAEVQPSDLDHSLDLWSISSSDIKYEDPNFLHNKLFINVANTLSECSWMSVETFLWRSSRACDMCKHREFTCSYPHVKIHMLMSVSQQHIHADSSSMYGGGGRRRGGDKEDYYYILFSQ